MTASRYNCSGINSSRCKEIAIHCVNGYIYIQDRSSTETTQVIKFKLQKISHKLHQCSGLLQLGKIYHFSLINDASICFRDCNFFRCQRWTILMYIVAILKFVQQQEIIFLFLYCLCFFRWYYSAANDFGSEIIPLAMKDYNVKVDSQKIIRDHYYLRVAISIICS